MNPSDSSEIQIDPTSAYHAMILEETNALFSSDWNQLQGSAPEVVNESISRMDVKVFKAAREGNIDALREHCDRLHQMLTPIKNTVLHVYIATKGSSMLAVSTDELLKQAEVVREMLRLCQRLLLQPNEKGDTALHMAARHGCAETVEVLIQAAKDWHGDLEEGISSREACHQFLIRRLNEETNTALHEAARFGHLDVVKILTKEDPEYSYPANDAGETPLYMAAERGYRKLAFEILDTCTNPSYRGPDDMTALHIAAANGHEQITGRLLEKEKRLALVADGRGVIPLHFAAFYGYVSIVKQILERDSSAAYSGRTKNKLLAPVHCAAMNGHVDVLEQLLLYCPDSFELVDHKGWNALHHAISSNENKVEEFVRKDPWLSSVLLNGKNSAGNTPLHQIANSGKYNGMEFIRDSRVDKMAFNIEKKNALEIIFLDHTDSKWKKNVWQDLRDSGARLGQRIRKIKDGGSEVHAKRGDEQKPPEDSNDKERKESHLVVSALIATVTFAAGITMPGGYQSEKGPDQGSAVLSTNAAFKAFVIANTLAMSMSSCAVMSRFFMLLRRREVTSGSLPYKVAFDLTMYALIAMVIAFITGTYAVLGSHSSLGLAIAASVLGFVVFFGLGAFLFLPAFSALRGRAATIYQRCHDFLYHFFHGNFEKLVPKSKV